MQQCCDKNINLKFKGWGREDKALSKTWGARLLILLGALMATKSNRLYINLIYTDLVFGSKNSIFVQIALK